MPFKLKDKSTLFGYDKQTSTFDAPVFEKDLGKISVGQEVDFVLTNQSNKSIKGKL